MCGSELENYSGVVVSLFLVIAELESSSLKNFETMTEDLIAV